MNFKLLRLAIQFDGRPNKNEGFSLVEVMVGILVLFGFVGAAMQALVASAAIKVKAQERSEATLWIQEDIELIRYRAGQLAANPSLCTATRTTGYADALRDNIVGASTATTSDTVISKTSALNYGNSSAAGNRTYTVNRTISLKDAAPYVVMTVSYNVPSPSNAAQSLSQMYTEVIPDKAFQCS
jgi:type II secretory pathway pseudopilin PulG